MFYIAIAGGISLLVLVFLVYQSVRVGLQAYREMSNYFDKWVK